MSATTASLQRAGSAPHVVYFPQPTYRINKFTLPVTKSERAFLLRGLHDVNRAVETILHGFAKPGEPFALRWDRKTLVRHALRLIGTLRAGDAPLLIIGQIQKRLIIHAIETNPYFVLPQSDPRLCAGAIRQADTLRLKTQALMGCRIQRFPIGLPPTTRGH